MRLLKKISSAFVALGLILNLVCFASAAPIEKEKLKSALGNLSIGYPEKYNSTNMPTLKQYPKIVDAVSQMLVDVKVDFNDLDPYNKNSLGYKLMSLRIDDSILKSNSPYKDIAIFSAYARDIHGYKFVSNYQIPKDKSLLGVIHFCYLAKIINNNGDEKFNFYWIDKDKCKEVVKEMMDGSFDIKVLYDNLNNDDGDLLFFKNTQDAVIKYFGDIDSFFNDEELCTAFFRILIEDITGGGKAESNGKKLIPIVSSDKSEAVKDYKNLGQSIVKKTLETKGLMEGKDYEIIYDGETGHIKEIKKGASSFLILTFVVLAVVVALVVILIVVIAKKKKKK